MTLYLHHLSGIYSTFVAKCFGLNRKSCEPNLFTRVTGLSIKEFQLLLSIGLFNDRLMNDVILAFRLYEDASLRYLGVQKHEDLRFGLFDTVISGEDARILGIDTFVSR